MSFPKATLLRHCEIGERITIDVSKIPEFKRFFYPGVTDVSFTLIQIMDVEEKTFYVISDNERVFSIQIEMPDTNAGARGFLDNEY